MPFKNEKQNRRLVSICIGMILSIQSSLCAQTYKPGQPLIARTPNSVTTDGIFWDATLFTGSDICAQIYAAWKAAMASGVRSATVDARGITGTQTCSASPFPSGASGRLLLGNTQIMTAVTWQIPARTIVEGMGVDSLDDHAVTANTLIRAGSSSADPVLQLGNDKHSTFAVQVKNLTVDASGLATIGVLNNSALEGSRLEDVNIYNATLYGLLLGQYDAQMNASGSGPYRNINVQYNKSCANCGRGTTGVAIISNIKQVGFPIRGLDNITVTGHGTPGRSLGSCIVVIGFPVQITNSHVEYCTTGIQIGAEGALETNNVQVQSVSTDPFAGWNITITNASDILLSGIVGFGPKLLQDNVTKNEILGKYKSVSPLGFYLLGDGPNPAVISTASTQAGKPLAWVAPGNLNVVGSLSKSSGSFKIDDPADPANRYLYHSFVESPDMLDVYNGSVTTDKRGRATVTLPDYFEKLNRDFRYQLTPIGTFAHAIVDKEIQNNQFTIRTSKPGVKVSWQVTGIRQDAYANAHRLKVEEEKSPAERGHYLHPELFESDEKLAEEAQEK